MDDKTIVDLFAELSRQIGTAKGSFDSLRQEMKEGFARIETRIANPDPWEARVEDWKRRLDKLEKKLGKK